MEARARLVGVSRPESHVTKFRQDRPNAVSLALVTNKAVRNESKGAIDARPGDCHVMPLTVAHGYVLGELEQKIKLGLTIICFAISRQNRRIKIGKIELTGKGWLVHI